MDTRAEYGTAAGYIDLTVQTAANNVRNDIYGTERQDGAHQPK